MNSHIWMHACVHTHKQMYMLSCVFISIHSTCMYLRVFSFRYFLAVGTSPCGWRRPFAPDGKHRQRPGSQRVAHRHIYHSGRGQP